MFANLTTRRAAYGIVVGRRIIDRHVQAKVFRRHKTNGIKNLVSGDDPVNFGRDQIGPGVQNLLFLVEDIKRGYIAPVHMEALGVARQLDESNSLRLKSPAIGDIAGGIRTPHLHLGDEVVLVDRNHFKSLLGQVAREVFEQRAASRQDYEEIIAPLAAAER